MASQQQWNMGYGCYFLGPSFPVVILPEAPSEPVDAEWAHTLQCPVLPPCKAHTSIPLSHSPYISPYPASHSPLYQQAAAFLGHERLSLAVVATDLDLMLLSLLGI